MINMVESVLIVVAIYQISGMQIMLNLYTGILLYDKKQAKLVSASKPHLDVIDNLNPSCPRCNNYKHTLTLEEFRKELSRQVERCMNNCNFTLALKYKQVSIHETPIVFYFERI